jgi:ABC-2 type transport system permease protein
MTTTASLANRPDTANVVPGAAAVTFRRVLRSEWIKFRSLRSTTYTFLTAFTLMVGLGSLFSWGFESHIADQQDELAGFDATLHSLRGMFLAQLAVGVLGVLMITGEYATGMIRASLTAVPHRLPVLWAKAVIFGLVSFAIMAVACFGAFLVGQHILDVQHLGVGIGDPHVLRAVLGCAAYLTGIGLLGLAIGAILRSTAGSIAALVAVVLVLPILGAVLPHTWSANITPYLPSSAGQAIMNVVPDPSGMAPWTGFALFAVYVVAALGVAAVLLRHRDA